ncbi:MAG: DUF692 family multinuclear iron-containing protein [Cellvibrio sp.]
MRVAALVHLIVGHLAVAAAEEAVAVVAVNFKDRVGLGWRPEISAHILQHLDHIDVLEVIADNYFSASQKDIQSLEFLARQTSVSLHGVGMGLASSQPVELRYLERMARLVNRVRPEFWSEHLAFVRAGSIEIGHLAAPPRNQETVAVTVNNIQAARNIVGSLPHMENIATLIQPPASSLAEGQWITEIIEKSEAPFLLDLHNLYANAKNFGQEPLELLQQLPLAHLNSIHLSGGCWIKEIDGQGERLLDDHIHDVPEDIFELLTYVAQITPQNLMVIIERDGNFPAFDQLLEQLDLARRALQKGRELRSAS